MLILLWQSAVREYVLFFLSVFFLLSRSDSVHTND